jgi:hypothetical protein
MRLSPGAAIAWMFVALVDALVITTFVVSVGGWRGAWPILLVSALAGAAGTAILFLVRLRERPSLTIR